MKIRPVRAELFHADGRKDRHDEANSRFSKFCEQALKRNKKGDMGGHEISKSTATQSSVMSS